LPESPAKNTTYAENPATASAIVVAAGSGVRMRGPARKQYLELQNRPILSRTLSVFEDCDRIGKICLVIPENDFDYVRANILCHLRGEKEIVLVAGGRERQNSVYNGIRAVDDKEPFVVVHDGVRPLVSPGDIERCLDGALLTGACILGLPAKETLKRVGRVDGEFFVEGTIDRDEIWHAQTPQAFRRDLLLKAHERAKAEAWFGTDDASLVERAGARVRIVKGNPSNVKITTPEDLILAENILSKHK
jgi:2-C-methyl-D-erythritol 4-phosphate cytidylyltransferase